jgi:hypothetical protein
MAAKKQVTPKNQNVVPLKGVDLHKKTQPHHNHFKFTDPGVKKIGHNMRAQVPRYRKAG